MDHRSTEILNIDNNNNFELYQNILNYIICYIKIY